MKKLILLLSLATPLWSLAQSTTIVPNAISIPKVSSLPTCSSNEKSNQVLNTTDNKMYYCNGTNWQEMTGGGFTLPYAGSASLDSPILSLENEGSGRAIYAKSFSATAIRAESTTSYGLFASSGSSSAVYGTSSSSFGGYFEAYGNAPTLFVQSSQGEAANFRGNVKIRDELVVDDNKGIVRSNSATQQKVVRGTIALGTTLAAGAHGDSGNYNYENFGDVPTVTVGQVVNATSTGSWHKVLVIPIDVTATECKFRVVNISNASITFSARWEVVIIGPE